jgi:UNC-50 family
MLQLLHLLDGLQFFALPVALGKGLLPLFISNTLYGAAFAWYWYITHLGYRALPFLSNTEVFLFPIAAIVVVYAAMLIGYPLAGFGFNATRVMARLYFIPS